MYHLGEEEIEAIAKVIRSRKIFRYHEESLCASFERRYASFTGTAHCALASSGSAALVAALAGLGIGPGDEVIVPAHTYMATALAVLQVGAIPVVVDVDESITLDPVALREAVGPRTRAVIPVHMWGLVCDMDPILRVAVDHRLPVVEDACQCVGGAYEGRPVGSMGDAGCYSFNAYKNMTCGEGGAVVARDAQVMQRARCAIDACAFFWTGKEEDVQPFATAGTRVSEIQAAMLHVQLDRLPAIIERLRAQKKRLVAATADCGLDVTPSRSPDHECGCYVMYRLPSTEAADAFAARLGGTVAGKTGRHTCNFWDPILAKRGSHHPDLDPFRMSANRGCRMDYSPDMCPRSLDILARTVMIRLDPDADDAAVDRLAAAVRSAAVDLTAGAA